MAKIGLNNFRYGILTEAQDGTPSYDGALKPAKAISCNVEVNNNDAKLYADDSLAESDTSFNNGTVTIGIDKADNETMASLLGHTVTDGEMVRATTDVAPYVGLGRVITEMINGAYKYRVEFLYKCKFAEPSQEDTTKGESVEFNTYELEGTVNALANGKWSITKSFDTKAEAIAYLEGLLDEKYTITYNANGGTGTVDSQSATAGTSVTLASGSGLTYSNHTFKGWNTTATATTVLTSPITLLGDMTLYAVWEANN